MTSQLAFVALNIGTHTWNPEDDKVDKIVELMRKNSVKNLDTARIYGGGASEKSIGVRNLPSEFVVDTKANTAIFPGSGRNILQHARESLEALNTDKVRTYFLHGPDETVPFTEQMEAIQKLYLEGYFERFGLSNFKTKQVLEIHEIAKERGYITPSVFQSGYSAAERANEEDLFPTLRRLGYSIQAYSPMAAGLLAKTPADIAAGKGNFDPKTVGGQIYLPMFNKPSYMQMLEEFGKLSEDSGISRTGLAYRWVRHHSFLKAELGDEMIIGGTTAEQVANALQELDEGPLEPWVAEEINKLWKIIKDDAPRDSLKHVRNAYNQSA